MLVQAVMLSAAAAADALETPPLLAISEIRVGALDHDTPGLWAGTGLERQAADANLEVLFTPWARAFGGYLRPAVGATINFNGDTSKVYADLRWEIGAPSGVFFALGMGAALHDGRLNPDTSDRKALGSPVLFHPSVELGYRFAGGTSISIFADHISNGYSRRNNDGMDTIGVRLGYRLGPLGAEEPVVEAPAASFSGFYVGALAGYSFEQADWFTGTSSRAGPSGAFSAAAVAGYNWQSGSGIFGLEVDASPLRSSLSTPCIGPAIACQMDVSGVYSVRPRFGWVIGNAMIYGTGGLALAHWDASVTNTASSAQLGKVSGINYGVAVGGGVEYKFSPHFGVRAEIMHYGIPGQDVSVGAGSATTQFQSTVGRVGLVWHF